MSEYIDIEAREGLNIIRMNRPEKKNALTQDMYRAITAALDAGEADETIRVHVVLGTPGAFSAGNDIADFVAAASGDAGLSRPTHLFLQLLAKLRKPLVTGVDGIAVGIGTTINFHADLTFATPRTNFHTPFVDLALTPEAGSSLLIPALAGHQQAFAMLGAGIPLSAEEAKAAGLIWKVVGEEALETETLAAAAALARKPPEALRIAKDLLRKTGREQLSERIDEEVRIFGERMRSAEAMAAFQAFMARKK